MGRTAEIEKIALLVQIDGKPYTVALSQDKLRILVNLASSLSEKGNLPVIPAPEEIYFKEN